MRTLRLTFLTFLCLASANAAFGIGFFGSAGADCDGDGKNDIVCSGGPRCTGVDEGAIPDGADGFCSCTDSNGIIVDIKKCKDLPELYPEASFFESQAIWQLLAPYDSDTCTTQEPETEPSQNEISLREVA